MNLIYVFNTSANQDIVDMVTQRVLLKIRARVLPTTPLIEDGIEYMRMILVIPDHEKTDLNTIFNLGAFVGAVEEEVTNIFVREKELFVLENN
jgi:hypothetical protein